MLRLAGHDHSLPRLSPHITCSAHLVIRSKIDFNNFVLDTNMRQYFLQTYLQTYLQINSYNTIKTETNMDKIVTFQIDYVVPLKNVIEFESDSFSSISLKDTTTICKKWVKSMFLILGNYLSPKEFWTNRFSVVGRTAFKLLICEKFNHDSCW